MAAAVLNILILDEVVVFIGPDGIRLSNQSSFFKTENGDSSSSGR